MNYFLLFPFLLINFCYFTNGEKNCDSILCTCIKSLISQGKCTKENYPTDFIEEPCTKMYSKCSSAKDECVIGACECFDLSIDCLIQDKCEYKTSLSSSTLDKRIF
uniref:Uncharacterized protein n=1 Tax=Meloidogyne enterolobii TaxID=390850 RepID=A0A6V7WBF7_MELEN|nr:unnamed protein product [Meloidogyne enterolobii]